MEIEETAFADIYPTFCHRVKYTYFLQSEILHKMLSLVNTTEEKLEISSPVVFVSSMATLARGAGKIQSDLTSFAELGSLVIM